MSAKADAEAAAALREERQSGSLSLEERKTGRSSIRYT
jgi:hypothetical protein